MNNIILVCDTEHDAQAFLTTSDLQEKIAVNASTAFYPEKNGYTIEQIRSIIDLSAHHYGEKSAFVLWNFDSAKEVVQNAFLKVLEEHSENIQFVLVVSSESSLLPTIVSRATVMHARSPHIKLSSDDEEHMIAIIHELQKKGTLASSLIKTTPAKKREDITAFIKQFILYGFYSLGTNTEDRMWLSSKLTRSIEALPLISQNFIDSEAVLDNIFLS